MNKPVLDEKNTEEVLSSVVFLISCITRIEDRLRLIERRMRDLESRSEGAPRPIAEPRSAARQVPHTTPPGAATSTATVKDIAIVVPVHNARDDVEKCLLSIFENGGYSRLVVIDDASDEPTASMLDALARRRDFTLIRNPTNLGYTKSINIGQRNSGDADAVVILNSDTVVTAGWIEQIRRAFNANPKVGIVGPWSNAATYQSVPSVKDSDGQFAINQLPAGISADDWAIAVGGRTPTYPRVPIINGFCFSVRSKVFDAIGMFDEVAFPIGYGEENDFCLRAADAGFEIAVADNAFVFHGKSKSFGPDRRKHLAAAGRAALDKKHGRAKLKGVVDALEKSRGLVVARSDAASAVVHAAPDSIFAAFAGSIAYVLPAKPGGGGVHSVVQEASYLAGQGIRTTIFVPSAELAAFHAFYGDALRPLITPYRGIHDLHARLRSWSVIVATVYRSVELVRDLIGTTPARFFYYVQDYEPFFHDEGSREYNEALASYDVDPRFTLFAKTKWLQQTVRERHGRAVRVVLPSLDHDTFFPPPEPKRHDRVAAMVRPSTPRRSPAETVALARKLATRKKRPLHVSLFGCDPDDEALAPVRNLARVECTGRLKREEVADLLRRSDVFVDLSTYQAFGRASIEGMACGCVPIVPVRGGSEEFAVPGWNSFAVDVADRNYLRTSVQQIDEIYARLDEFRAHSLETASRYSVRAAAVSILKTFME
jgi:GT2 family glycosyltransferase/glycosyltransferase involved in cell wall biosynthesis